MFYPCFSMNCFKHRGTSHLLGDLKNPTKEFKKTELKRNFQLCALNVAKNMYEQKNSKQDLLYERLKRNCVPGSQNKTKKVSLTAEHLYRATSICL